MKAEIHPEYADTAVTCSCGNTFTTRSTVGGIYIWTSAPNATRSTPVNRKFLIPPGGSTSSAVGTA